MLNIMLNLYEAQSLLFNYSILGMNLFGCKFCRKTEENTLQCDRKNFDSLLWALVTVFQVSLLVIVKHLFIGKSNFFIIKLSFIITS